MDGEALYHDIRGACVEVLIFNPARRVAVNGIGKIRAEFFNVKVVCSLAYLLVGSEGDADLSVRAVFAYQPLGKGHYLGDPRLVVGTEKSISGGGYKRPAAKSRKVRKIRNAEDGSVTEVKVAAAVVLGYPRNNVVPGALR